MVASLLLDNPYAYARQTRFWVGACCFSLPGRRDSGAVREAFPQTLAFMEKVAPQVLCAPRHLRLRSAREPDEARTARVARLNGHQSTTAGAHMLSPMELLLARASAADLPSQLSSPSGCQSTPAPKRSGTAPDAVAIKRQASPNLFDTVTRSAGRCARPT